MTPQRAKALKEILEKALADFVASNEIQSDALAPALRYSDWHDQEFAAFVCGVLAYGRVEHIKKSISRALGPMGDRPHQYLMNSSDKDLKKLSLNWSHRFNTADDLFLLLRVCREIYREYGSIEKFVLKDKPSTVYELLENFVSQVDKLVESSGVKPSDRNSFWFFFPRPSRGSACKRLNLYLRWMIGRGPLDLKLWKNFSPSILIIPLDVHVLRQARSLKLTKRKQADWVTAEEVTASLRHLDRDDPVQYDFALCHLGMRGKILSHNKKGSD